MDLKLREFRRKAGMTQKDLANALGADLKTVGNWERGETIMSIEQLWKCAEVLGCTPDDLCGWRNGAPLASDEQELLGCYRASTPQWKNNILMTARAAAGQSREDAEGAAPAEKVS